MKGPVASNSFYCPISMELMADPVSWKLCAHPIRREGPLVMRETAGHPAWEAVRDLAGQKYGLSASLTSVSPMLGCGGNVAGRANLT